MTTKPVHIRLPVRKEDEVLYTFVFFMRGCQLQCPLDILQHTRSIGAEAESNAYKKLCFPVTLQT